MNPFPYHIHIISVVSLPNKYGAYHIHGKDETAERVSDVSGKYRTSV
jgi:hypothetical protein